MLIYCATWVQKQFPSQVRPSIENVLPPYSVRSLSMDPIFLLVLLSVVLLMISYLFCILILFLFFCQLAKFLLLISDVVC
jgi:hypothetical protein